MVESWQRLRAAALALAVAVAVAVTTVTWRTAEQLEATPQERPDTGHNDGPNVTTFFVRAGVRAMSRVDGKTTICVLFTAVTVIAAATAAAAAA